MDRIKHTTEQKIIAKLLKTSTGTHFLDSGGAYGRHWQRNQTRNFYNEDATSLSFDVYSDSDLSIEYTKNIFHFLSDTLRGQYNMGLNRSYMAYAKKNNDSWAENLESWAELKGYKVILRDNTYNSENNLSQDFIFTLFAYDNNASDIYDCDFISIEIHNGCDARGGYTHPVFFDFTDEVLFYSNGDIFCENGHSWYTDDSYNWYFDGGTQGNQLNHYKGFNYNDWLDDYKESDDYKELERKQIVIPDNQLSMLPDYKPSIINPIPTFEHIALKLATEQNKVLVKDNIGYCPVCAENGILSELKG